MDAVKMSNNIESKSNFSAPSWCSVGHFCVIILVCTSNQQFIASTVKIWLFTLELCTRITKKSVNVSSLADCLQFFMRSQICSTQNCNRKILYQIIELTLSLLLNVIVAREFRIDMRCEFLYLQF